MPPANSPAEGGTPADRSRPATPASFRSALRELASPVPDYASTLTIQAEDDIDAENVSFLRAPVSPTDQELPALESPPSRDLADGNGPQRRLLLQERARALARGDPPPPTPRGVRRVRHSSTAAAAAAAAAAAPTTAAESQDSAAERRRHDLWAERMSQHAPSAYSDRVPSQQSLYDWAPATEEGDDEELDAVLYELRRQQPNTHPEILRVLARADIDATRDLRNRPPSQRSGSSQQEPSLRSAAILQSVRRNWRFSTRSRMMMSRYIMDRDRAGQDNNEGSMGPAPQAGSIEESRDGRTDPAPADLPRPENNQTRQHVSRGGMQQPDPIEAMRRRYLEMPPSNQHSNNNHGSHKALDFENIIECLHDQRFCHFDEAEKRALGIATGPVSPAQVLSGRRKFWLDTSKLRPPPTSWLAAGTMFSGKQQATAPMTSSTTLFRLANNQSMSSTTIQPPVSRSANPDPFQPWLGQHLTSTPLSFHATPAATPPGGTSGAPPDRWTVKVAIHAVDYDKMTLQGTMEAFNVPSVTGQSMSSAPPATSASSGLRASSTSSANQHPNSSAPSSSAPNAATNGEGADASKTTFSTYLEGEIIDFSTHTLLTEPDRFSVKTTAAVDAAYWRRLEPFAKLSDSDIARALLDHEWVEEGLVSRYVLMRWKERCFVKPTFTSFSNLNPADRAAAAAAHPHPSTHRSFTTAATRQHHHRAAAAAAANDHHDAEMPDRDTDAHMHEGGEHDDDAEAEGGAEAEADDDDEEEAAYRPTPPSPQHSATTSFLSGADGNGYGLSISGFYYVSLRRSDGRCEGLYYDPQSSPYQHLELRPTEGTWGSGSWEFR